MKKLLMFLLFLALVSSITYGVITVYDGNRSIRDSDAQIEMKPKLEYQDPDPDESSLPLMDFSGLQEENSDIIAWLTIPGTIIDYPVTQTDNNKYYLNHTAEKKYNVIGALFLDHRNNKDFSDFYSIIYGHHMKNGKMFGQLSKFKDKAFFDATETGTLYTPEKTYRFEIFAVAVTKSTGGYYNYIFPALSDREEHLAMIKATAKFYRDIGVTAEDRLLALSTCSYEYKDARTLVIGRLVG